VTRSVRIDSLRCADEEESVRKSLNATLRRQLQQMEPTVRASLIDVITRHRQDYTVTELASFSNSRLQEIAESCVPEYADIDLGGAIKNEPPSLMRNVEFLAPHSRSTNVFDHVPRGPLAFWLFQRQEALDWLRDRLDPHRSTHGHRLSTQSRESAGDSSRYV
jgi:hypothetical protein